MLKLALHVLLSLGLAGIITSVVLLRQTSADSPEINAIISTISSLRSSLKTLLAPPYIYLLLNLIIISIAASSSLLHRYFHHNHHHNDAVHSDDYIHHDDEFNAPDPPIEQPERDSDSNSSDSSISVRFVEADDKFDVNLDETWSKIADENRKERRLRKSDGDVRSKFGQLVENDDGDGDTLEALWKSIAEENKRKHSENRTPPLLSKADLTKPDDLSKAWDAMKAKGGGGGERRRRSDSAAVAVAPRRLRKSESTRPRGGVRKGEVKKEKAEKAEEEEVTAGKELRKSETFNDAVSARRRGGMLRRDPSLSVDELNGRVEAFINNFNHQMRLQRQESEQRFLDMMKRGV